MKYLLTIKQEIVFKDNLVELIVLSVALLISWIIGAVMAGYTDATWMFVTTIILMVVWVVHTSFLGVVFYQFMTRPIWGN